MLCPSRKDAVLSLDELFFVCRINGDSTCSSIFVTGSVVSYKVLLCVCVYVRTSEYV